MVAGKVILRRLPESGMCLGDGLDDVHEAATADHPLFAGEDAWADFDEAGQHVEDATRGPLGFEPRLESPLVESGRDFRERLILNNHFEHDQERLFFLDVLFQRKTILGDFQAIRDGLGDVGWSCRSGLNLTFPNDGYRSPSLGGAEIEGGLGEWPGKYFSHTFDF